MNDHSAIKGSYETPQQLERSHRCNAEQMRTEQGTQMIYYEEVRIGLGAYMYIYGGGQMVFWEGIDWKRA